MRKSRKQKRWETLDLFILCQQLQRIYKVSAIDVYMQLAYYNGLSTGLCGVGLYERCQPSSEELHFAKSAEDMREPFDKNTFWHAQAIASQCPFPHLPRAQWLEDEHLENFAYSIDVVEKIRDVLVDMCAELAERTSTGKDQEAMDFMYACDEKIMHMFSALQDEINACEIHFAR